MKDGSKEASLMAQAYRGEWEEEKESNREREREQRERKKRLINVPRPHFN